MTKPKRAAIERDILSLVDAQASEVAREMTTQIKRMRLLKTEIEALRENVTRLLTSVA